MADLLNLEGLPSCIALRRVLEHRGVEASMQMLDEEEDRGFTIDGLLEKLRANGFEARSVQAHTDDLVHLQLPTLLLTHKSEWIVLRKKTNKGWLVEHGGGVALVPRDALAGAFSGTVLEINASFSKNGGLWIRLFRLLQEHRQFLYISLGATALAQGLALISPWLTTKVINGALTNGADNLLQVLCIGMILTAFFRAWASWLRDISLNSFSTRIDVDLEKGIFDHLLHLPFKHLQRKTLGELLQAFSGIKRARTQLLNRGLAAIFDAGMAIAYLAYMIILMPAVAGIVFLGALLLGVTSAFIGYLQAQQTSLQIKASQEKHSALAELLNGAPTFKATGSQNWVLARWKEKLGAELTYALKQDRIGLWEDAISELLSQGSSICILIWGGFKVLGGELSLGELLAFSQLSGAFMGTITNLSQTLLSTALAHSQLAEVHEAFATLRQPIPSLKGPSPSTLAGPILAEDVWFRYEEKGPWILHGSNLRVEPGAFHQVKGASGSGKSTLLKLLAGLYTPDSGRIRVGGQDSVAATSLMVFLPQFPQLSSGSILENLRIFSGDRPQDHLFKVAQETGLDEWVKTLPMGYRTIVASNGSNFSGGQRQLIGITAVLASDKQLLLLDEALSNLDWLSRQRILQCSYFQGRTVIYASHEEVIVGTSNLDKRPFDSLPALPRSPMSL